MSKVATPTNSPSDQLYGVLYSLSWSVVSQQWTVDPVGHVLTGGSTSAPLANRNTPYSPLVPADAIGVETRGR